MVVSLTRVPAKVKSWQEALALSVLVDQLAVVCGLAPSLSQQHEHQQQQQQQQQQHQQWWWWWECGAVVGRWMFGSRGHK